MVQIRKALLKEDERTTGGQFTKPMRKTAANERSEYDYVDMSQWTLEEELIVNMKDALQPDELGWFPPLQKLWARRTSGILADLVLFPESKALRILTLFVGVGVLFIA